MTVDGDPRLFALDKGTAEELMVHLASLREITQPTIHRARLDAITFTGAGGEITAQWLLDGDITDADAASNWRMTVPYAYPAEESAMTALRKNLTNLRLGAYVAEATAENLTAYGNTTLGTINESDGTCRKMDNLGEMLTIHEKPFVFFAKARYNVFVPHTTYLENGG